MERRTRGAGRTALRTAVRLGVAALVLVATGARAQIVNVQALFSETAPPGLSGGVDASADWRTGSNDFLALRGTVAGQWRGEVYQVLGLARAEYGLSEGTTTLNRYLEHLRLRRRLTERVSLEAFAQHELDSFRRLQLRALLGVGPRVRVWEAERASLVLGVAAMLEHERLRHDALPDAGARTTDVRLSATRSRCCR